MTERYPPMSISTSTPGGQRRFAWVALPAPGRLVTEARASVARLRERFGAVESPTRVPALQLEHLYAYTMESEGTSEVEE